SIPEAAPTVFEIVEEVVSGTPSAITADNYEPAIRLFNEFATAGRVGAAQEQREESAVRKGKPVKEKKRP
ncbi:GDP/GTP exchange factor for ARF, partial [Cryomyces antarcticus]